MAGKLKLSTSHIRRTLENSGLSAAKQRELLASLTAPASDNVRLKPEHIRRITDTLRRDGKAGIFVTNSGKIYVFSGSHVQFTNFNFNNEEIRQKANEARSLMSVNPSLQ